MAQPTRIIEANEATPGMEIILDAKPRLIEMVAPICLDLSSADFVWLGIKDYDNDGLFLPDQKIEVADSDKAVQFKLDYIGGDADAAGEQDHFTDFDAAYRRYHDLIAAEFDAEAPTIGSWVISLAA